MIKIGKQNYGYHPANNSSYEEKEIKSFISTDFDGYNFIDYFNNEIHFEMSVQDKFYLNKLREIIVYQLQHNENKPYIKLKYEWMKDKFNVKINAIKSDNRISVGGITIGSEKNTKFYKKLKPI
jgi:hypothetical protein